MIKINKKITGYKIAYNDVEVKPQKMITLNRPETVSGVTYKIKQPLMYEHGIYLTINSIELEGKTIPFELFFNTKNVEIVPYLNLMALTLTTLFRNKIDITHLLVEYNTIHDIRGGYRAKSINGEKPKWFNHIIGEISDVIYNHINGEEVIKVSKFTPCPECGGETTLLDNCLTCLDCGFSKCG
jgi:ribonucleoside-diphosphate reductase alpha chain